MLHILFLPGTFGTTIFSVLETFNKKKYSTVDLTSNVLHDGSMHQIFKSGHWTTRTQLEDFLRQRSIYNSDISTPIYPMPDFKTDEIIKFYSENFKNDKYIFIYVENLEWAELNLLFQYYKIAKGSLNLSLNIFCGKNEKNITQWNTSYTHWSQMKTWELREWFSIFYPGWIQEWVEAKKFVPANWLTISSGDILNDTINTFTKICNFYQPDCNIDTIELGKFVSSWLKKQQYIVDEYRLIDNIVDSVTSNKELSWDSLNIISEAIVQKKLRSKGYEIKCHELNSFPTSTEKLYSLLEKIS